MTKPKRRNPPQDLSQKMAERLRKDFGCTEEQITMLTHVLRGDLPTPDAEYLLHLDPKGKREIHPDLPPFLLQQEDGTVEEFSLTNHPLNRMLLYLIEKYGETFSLLYWIALTDMQSPQRFYRELAYCKKHVLSGLFNPSNTAATNRRL